MILLISMYRVNLSYIIDINISSFYEDISSIVISDPSKLIKCKGDYRIWRKGD